MGQTLFAIRIFFFLFCVAGSFLVCLAVPEWESHQGLALFIGACIGSLVVLVDIMLKGFSLRGLTALTFGLFMGWLVATFISNSPLFEYGDPEMLYIARLVLFVVLTYLGAVLALRGKDEFHLVIPYMRFVPEQVEAPLAVVDTSALIDGRLVEMARSKFLAYSLVIPRFVLEELHAIADSPEPQRQQRGRRGLETLNELRGMPHVDLRIDQSEVENRNNVDAKIVFLAQTLKAKVITTDYNLAQVAAFHGIDWLNLNRLSKALIPNPLSGDRIEVELVKQGRENGQAVGYLEDGSMVVVNEGVRFIGQTVEAEILSILPSGNGKMIFAQLAN
jgi:uncharacterized protein YacL